MKNTIFLRRKNKVIVKEMSGSLSKQFVGTMLKNIEDLGYTFSEKLIERVSTLTEEKAIAFYQQLVYDLKKMVGADVKHKPMYPNFPEQVMEMDEAELYTNAILHYIGDLVGIRIMPETEVKERFPLLDNVKLTVIDLGKKKEFDSIFTKLVGANTSISETDKNDLLFFVSTYEKLGKLLPESIPNKENLSYVTGLFMRFGGKEVKDLTPFFKTATDVLRLATALSDGDVSLASDTKFRNFSRPERRMLLGFLENTNPTEDMLRFERKWQRLGERIHPFQFKDRFPKSFEAFDVIRNHKEFETFNGTVERLIIKGQAQDAADLLKNRPGEFARRLDKLVRTKKTKNNIIVDKFGDVASKIATPVLLQVKEHFTHRTEGNEYRAFFPKGNVSKVKLIDDNLPPISKKACNDIVKICKDVLVERFKELPSLGKVFLDDKLKGYLVPFSQRSASNSLKTIVRGSRVKMNGSKNTLRFFIHWKDQKDRRVDVDLSAVMYGKEWEYMHHLSYTNLRTNGGAHSDDIASAPRGASEFIDIDIPTALSNGARYIVMSVFSFTQQPFNEIPECFAGWMLREKPKSGEIYDPKTVEDKVDLTSDRKTVVPVIFDLETREAIWADMGITDRNSFWGNNLESNQPGMVATGIAMTTLKKPTLHGLFSLHVKARGKKVDKKEDADTVFSLNGDVTPYDMDTIMSDYLT